MARKPTNIAALADAAEHAVKHADRARELREAQAVLLPALHGMSLEDTGRLIGRSRATVVRLRGRFKRGVARPEEPARQWGGRRRQNTSTDGDPVDHARTHTNTDTVADPDAYPDSHAEPHANADTRPGPGRAGSRSASPRARPRPHPRPRRCR